MECEIKSQDERETFAVFVERKDGQWADFEVVDYGENSDLWTCIGEDWPVSYELMDEKMIFVDDPAYHHSSDESFGLGEDAKLAAWLAEPLDDTYEAVLPSGAWIQASRRDGWATVTWEREGVTLEQTIGIEPEDFAAILAGRDPVADGWEDGAGNPVCIGNSRGEVPDGMWAQVLQEASWEPWDQGDSYDEQVQEGTWRGMRVTATYRIGDPEAFEAALREDEDAAYLHAMVSMVAQGGEQ